MNGVVVVVVVGRYGQMESNGNVGGIGRHKIRRG